VDNYAPRRGVLSSGHRVIGHGNHFRDTIFGLVECKANTNKKNLELFDTSSDVQMLVTSTKMLVHQPHVREHSSQKMNCENTMFYQ
jgi:hypothetical protein